MSTSPLLDQVKEEVSESLAPVFKKNPELKAVFENIAEPEKVHRWKAVWDDDKGNTQINTCWRVQQNSALGPYKGGLRFDSSVTLDVLRFLALEQVFKNALTGKAIGGGKGGSDFNPKGKSEKEIKRFCQAFMKGLHKVVGPDVDVPAGDIGVNGKVIGYLFGEWKQLGGGHNGVLSGKSILLAGSNVRTEATGYGVMYLLVEHLKATKNINGATPLSGKTISITGSGNVATYCAKKAIQLGAKVLTLSDRNQTYFAANGMSSLDVDEILAYKASKGKSKLPSGIKSFPGKKAWQVLEETSTMIDVASPCATQNEINEQEARLLVKLGCSVVIEGSNLSSTAEAVAVYRQHEKQVDYIGSKLANLGGVGTSFLEMMQNSGKAQWPSEKVDEELHQIMVSAYKMAKDAAAEFDVSLTDGANIASFLKVADAMKQLGYA